MLILRLEKVWEEMRNWKRVDLRHASREAEVSRKRHGFLNCENFVERILDVHVRGVGSEFLQQNLIKRFFLYKPQGIAELKFYDLR